jgi:hypothetical protein
MTTYEGFPGHEEIRNEMDNCENEKKENEEDEEEIEVTLPAPMPRQLSSSSGDYMPCAPPCSLSGSSENLTANMNTTGMG